MFIGLPAFAMDVVLLILERDSNEGGTTVSMSVFGAAAMVVLPRPSDEPVHVHKPAGPSHTSHCAMT